MCMRIKTMLWGCLGHYYAIVVLVIHLVGHGEALKCSVTEQQVLLDFKAAIPGFDPSLNWTGDSNCCTWQGVSCEVYPLANSVLDLSPAGQVNTSQQVNMSLALQTVQVFSLSLPSCLFKAELPPVLASLTHLRHLNLSDNRFFGAIPEKLTSLSSLQVLDLSHNNLTGSLTVLNNLSSLQIINVSGNFFTGGLPSYRNLSNLEEFLASENSLGGRFSTDICQHIPKLTVLDFSTNNFSGPLLEGLSLCTQLQVLNLGINSFTGSIPGDLFNLTSLSILQLDSNSFSGEIGEMVGNLENLTELILCNNKFEGALPKALSQNSKLTALLLCMNNFTGTIDVNFSNMTYLDTLDLNSNNFYGSIPAMVNCSKLRVVSLSKNNFIGQIPSQFNTLKNLTSVTLSTNMLTGNLGSLVSCQNLVSLVLTKNQFQESLPETLDGFRNLQVLALGFLNLSGQVPLWLQNCTKLQILDLSWNHFEGEIPYWLGNLQHLMYLELSNNSFSGSIPRQIFSLKSMMHNDTNSTGLQVVQDTFVVKRQSDSIGLTYNNVEALPVSLLLSNNRLTGEIPEEIGHLGALVHLDLSHNLLSGSIAKSLANISGLETLDLSYNHLSGSIPTSLTRLTFLAIFNVSFNNLSGQIPQGNQFSSFVNTSYEGNPNLCGYPVLQACAPTDGLVLAESASSSRRGPATILGFTSVGVGLVMLLLGALFWILSRRNAVHQGLESSRDMNVPESLSEACSVSIELYLNNYKLKVGDLRKATNNFDSANIVGCGGFGLVYRADLADGSQLAIKKLTGDCGQMEREFKAEVEALSKAQHRNLVSLQGCFHVGNEKLLIYSYMENGSLDYWLHEKTDGAARLDWPTRLNIAQGAAAGLSYLHQVCNPHIVHRDIKSSNILLDEHFEAHLADFGLARMLMATDTHVTTELVGTLGYIPPEYSEALNATTRGDVYSFGMVLLELLTGKRPVDVCKPKGCRDLVAWVQEMRKDHKLDQIFDSHLRSKNCEEQMQQVLEIACSCINHNPLKRPVIRDVVMRLNEIGQVKHIFD